MYTYKIGISAQEHDAFVASHPQSNLLQSSNWAIIKDNWSNQRIGFYENDHLVATASLLIKSLPAGFTMIYIPRGPIMDYTSYELVAFVISTLKAYGRKQHALFIKCDPLLHLKQYPAGTPEENQEENELNLSIVTFLTKIGVEWSGPTKDLTQTIQPRVQANLYAQAFSLDNLPKKTKQAIRSAKNKGVEVIYGGEELLEDFAALMAKTQARKSIHLRGIDYYRKLLATYPNQSYITMAQLNLPQRLAELEAQISKLEQTKATFTENTRVTKVKDVNRQLERLNHEVDLINSARKNGKSVVPLAATLSLIFGDTSENLYAGMDDSYRQYQAPLLTWYETAKEAFRRGCAWQNMGGVENNLDGGLYQFKARLNPMIEEFAGEFTIPVSPLHKPAMLAYSIRKQMRSKHS